MTQRTAQAVPELIAQQNVEVDCVEPLLHNAAATAGRQLAYRSDVHGARLALTTAYDHTCSLSLMPESSRIV